MIETTTTPAMTDTELEAWFAAAGLTATVVQRCPAPACEACIDAPGRTFAEAA